MRFYAAQNRNCSQHCWDVFDREHPDQTRARSLLKQDAETLVFVLNDVAASSIGREVHPARM